MKDNLIRQHLRRVWRQHWPLQLASVVVMTTILVLFNLLSASVRGVEQLMYNWGQGLEMVVYVKDSATSEEIGSLQRELEGMGRFSTIHFTSKKSATEAFLKSLGRDSSALLSDPEWHSPLPASFEARLENSFAAGGGVAELNELSVALKKLSAVEDIFYGQGWVENFARFLSQARILVVGIWILALCIGLLIIGNCIRLSFLQRKEEVEVLELVGATTRFIRIPFVFEGIFLGVVSSVLSLAISLVLHTVVLQYFKVQWTFWSEWSALRPLEPWMILLNIVLGVSFGALGSWLCVRKLNTGWLAVQGTR